MPHGASAVRLGSFGLLFALACSGCEESAARKAARGPARDAGVNAPISSGDAGEYVFPCFNLPPPSGAPTFLAVYREVFCVAGCADSYCHGSRGESGGLSFETPAIAYAQLVGASAGPAPAAGPIGCASSELLRVVPGDAQRSLLYRKLSDAAPPCGARMPLDRRPLSASQLEQLRTWIERGAHADEHADDHDASADAG
jgi:hypothetical protein